MSRGGDDGHGRKWEADRMVGEIISKQVNRFEWVAYGSIT